jgi:putative DNA primase/helicase
MGVAALAATIRPRPGAAISSRSEKGAIKACRENLVMALDGWPDRGIPGVVADSGLIAFNEFSNNVEKTRPRRGARRLAMWLEADELLMGDWLVREHWHAEHGAPGARGGGVGGGRRHAFHPLRERMRVCAAWDGAAAGHAGCGAVPGRGRA